MVNSVDPDPTLHTAVSDMGLLLFAKASLSQYLGMSVPILRVITVALGKTGIQINLFLHKNIYCGYSLEMPLCAFVISIHVFVRNKKNICTFRLKRCLIWSDGILKYLKLLQANSKDRYCVDVQADLSLFLARHTCYKVQYRLLTTAALGYVLFVCVEVSWPSQPNGVMLNDVSLPNHTFTGQSSKRLTSKAGTINRIID